MRVDRTDLPGVLLLRPERFRDSRGYFVEAWNRRAFAEVGIETDFLQDNLACSDRRGTVRGLHYQRPPRAQAKLISVVKGRILDVVVDLRRASRSYGRHIAVELSSEGGAILYIPAGFAHGYCTLEPDVLVAYKVSEFWAPELERSIHWLDTDLAIAWPVAPAEAVISPRDAQAGPFAGIDHGFAAEAPVPASIR